MPVTMCENDDGDGSAANVFARHGWIARATHPVRARIGSLVPFDFSVEGPVTDFNSALGGGHEYEVHVVPRTWLLVGRKQARLHLEDAGDGRVRGLFSIQALPAACGVLPAPRARLRQLGAKGWQKVQQVTQKVHVVPVGHTVATLVGHAT